MDLDQRHAAPPPTRPGTHSPAHLTPRAATATGAPRAAPPGAGAAVPDTPGSDRRPQHARQAQSVHQAQSAHQAQPAQHDRRAGGRGPGWKGILREPFRARTWVRPAYLPLALPFAILCVPLALVGGPAGRIQRGPARRLLGMEVAAPERTGPLAPAHALISLPLNLIALAVAALCALLSIPVIRQL
ncbi:hypothetical protein ABR738_13055 [Streptomyces sp. Edi4]|uniref:hypothetical protein n=1 Tax=Streptomyces sp. Edi4 TaxID=3162527 RepID=UPI0033065D79